MREPFTQTGAPAIHPLLSADPPLPAVLALDPRNFTDCVLVTIKGMAVAFARHHQTATHELVYSILELPGSAAASTEPAWTAWRALNFSTGAPAELRVAGMSLLTLPQTAIPVDPADAPFQIVADSSEIFCFRPSKHGTVYLNHLRLIESRPVSTGTASARASVPKFAIEFAWEARFVASADRDLPADDLDRRGVASVVGSPFLEPTIELTEVRAADKELAVAAVPSSDDAVSSWYVITSQDDTLRVWRYTRDRDSSIRAVEPKDSFDITPHLAAGAAPERLILTGPVAASAYFQQERLFDGDDPAATTTLRRAGHLMICAGVKIASAGDANAVIVYDFGIDAAGRIPKIAGTPLTGGVARLLDGRIKAGKFEPDDAAKSYPIPAEALRVVDGLPVSAVVLGSVRLRGTTAPLIFPSADGLVHLYYCGELLTDKDLPSSHGRFLVAQFDTRVSRMVWQERWIQQGATGPGAGGTVRFTAVTPGQALTGTRVDIVAESYPDLCTVSIRYGEKSGLGTEVWRGVPRDLEHFLNTLNGNTSADPSSPEVQAGRITYYDGSGLTWISRIPLEPMPKDDAFRRYATFVATRKDTPLQQVAITTQNSLKKTVVLTFRGGNAVLLQRWPGLPADVEQLLPILNGTAHPGAYRSDMDPDETRIFALVTDAGESPILLYRVKTNAIEIKVSSVGKADECHFQIVKGLQLTVPRGSQKFAEAVLASAAFKEEFVHVSVGSTSASLNDQTVSALSRQGMTSVFDVLLPDETATGQLVSWTQHASAVQERKSTPRAERPSMRGFVALTRDRPADAARAVIVDSPRGEREPPIVPDDGAWLREEARYASVLTGGKGWVVDLTRASAIRLRLGLAMTFEGWIRPDVAAEASLLTYYDREETSPAIRQTQKVVVKTLAGKSLQFPLLVAGTKNGVALEEQRGDAAPNLTIELWLRLLDEKAPGETVLLEARRLDAGEPSLELLLQEGRLALRWPEGNERRLLRSETPLPPDRWLHVVVSGRELLTPDGELELFVDGASVSGGTATLDSRADIWRVGPSGSSCWRLSTLNVWNEPHPAAWLRAVAPSERAVPASSLRLTLDDAGSLPDEAWIADAQNQDLAVQVGSEEPSTYANQVRVGAWTHIAVTARAGGGLHLNPPGFYEKGIYHRVDCGNAAGLNFVNGGAFGARVTVNKSRFLRQAILSKGRFEPARNYAYVLYVALDGKVKLAVSSDAMDPGLTTVSTPWSIFDGKSHGIYAEVQTGSTRNQKGHNGAFTAVRLWVEHEGRVHFFEGGQDTTSPAPNAIKVSEAPLMLGCFGSAKGTELSPSYLGLLNGTISDVRVWSALPDALRGKPYPSGHLTDPELTRDLIAEWLFDEPGTIARDTAGEHHAVISHPGLHVVQPGRVDVYIDGKRREPSGKGVGDSNLKAGQFVIGGALQADGTPVRGFQGKIAEMRHWPIVRTETEIRTTRHRAITGGDPGLGAAWKFPASGDTAEDLTSFGNGARLENAQPGLPEAPVGNEPAIVRNVYGHSDRNVLIKPQRPSVCTFVHQLSAVDAVPQSILRQCHAFETSPPHPGILLDADFNLGSLAHVYIGQAYSEPKLVGYIEGAPPVPSENLSQPYWLNAGTVAYRAYLGATRIAWNEVVESVRESSASTTVEAKGELTGKAGAMGLLKLSTGASLAAAVLDRTVEYEWEVMVKGKLGASAARDAEAALSATLTKGRSVSISLTGQWEEPRPGSTTYLNPDVGRRFIPNNVGAAVLEATAADIYSLLLTTTGTMVAVVAVADPVVGADTGIIMFPLDPSYVKNGTLDGKIGYVNDPDYPNADTAWGSYCKPHETRLLEKDLERRTADVMVRHAQHSRALWAEFFSDRSARLEEWYHEAASRVGIVSTYSWTHTGGLIADMASVTLKYDRKVTVGAGLLFGLGVEGKFKVSSKAGFTSALDAMGTVEIKQKVGAVETQRVVTSMELLVNCEAFLQTWKPEQMAFTAGPGPGKVTGYRFKSFFLPPSSNNATDFSAVVDREWLHFSNSPDAAAIRSALARSAGRPVWRVLHRVTYVSRVAPSGSAPKAALATVRTPPPVNQDENSALIALIAASAGSSRPYTQQKIVDAVNKVLGIRGGGNAELDTISWWKDFRTLDPYSADFYRIKRRVQQYMLRLLLTDGP